MTPRSWTIPLACALVVLAGCMQPDESSEGPGGNASDGGGTGDGSAAGTAVTWSEHAFLGRILTDADGRTLYVFTEDPPGESACEDACASAWPPFTGNASAGGNLSERLTTITRADGSAQVALDERPLYYYASDEDAGDALGQGRNGAWFVVRESDAPGQLNVDFLDGPGEHAVTGENVTYGPDAAGYLAQPPGVDDAPGVVMIHEWWGLNAHIRAMADALASHGYRVLAVDLFNGSVATTPEDAMAQVQALDPDAAVGNMRAAAAHLRDAGAPRVASLGWCFGGGQSLELALSGEDLAATVIYYGQLVTDERRLDAIDWPVLGVFGAEDQSIPVADVRAFEAALANASVDAEVHVYEGVGHAFANPSGDAYAPEPAMDAWAVTLAFLEEHVRA